MSLYLKYRPKTFKSFIGNEKTLKSLKSIIKRDRKDVPHAMLFTGPSGCGKTTLARITAKKLKCSKEDFHELDAADFRGIDTVREIRKYINFCPTSGDCSAWLLDECHKLTTDAQDALLKALEDTPEHVYFLLATTDPQKLIKTIRNRCMEFSVSPLTDEQLIQLMNTVIESESKSVPEDVIEQIAMDVVGSSRAALVILDMIIDLDEDDMLEAAKQRAVEENQVIELCRALLHSRSWKDIAKILKSIDQDPEKMRRMVLGYCNSVLLNSGNSMGVYEIMDAFRDNFFDTGKAGLTLACYEATPDSKS